ncbi:MAG: hypothetical protein ACI3YT_07005 [Prevotella sp.]|uniref:hypothetical protein n=1 Tax=Ruminococcus sp. TaxID=41978 RepID=UPI003F0DEC72
MKRLAKQLRLKIFGGASGDEIKQFILGFVFVTTVFICLYLALTIIGLLQGY